MDYPQNEHGQLLHPEYGYVICGSNKKQPNKYGDYICLNRPATKPVNHDKCHMHGAKSLRGAAHPNFTTGQRSKYAPAKVAARYEEALEDPRLMDLTSNIALREAFIRERLEALDNAPDPAQVWQDMTKQLNALEVAYSQADSVKMAQALRAMRSLISERTRYHKTRNEIESALDSQSRDIEREKRLKLQGEHAASADEIVFIMKALLAFMTQEFADDRNRLNKALGFLDGLFFAGHPELVAGDTPAANGNN